MLEELLTRCLAPPLANATSHLYQSLRKVWIEIAVTDPGAFHVTLGNAATFLAKLRGDNDPFRNPEIVRHYGRSMTLLRQRLMDPGESIQEGTIANILAHLCLSVSYRSRFLSCFSCSLLSPPNRSDFPIGIVGKFTWMA